MTRREWSYRIWVRLRRLVQAPIRSADTAAAIKGRSKLSTQRMKETLLETFRFMLALMMKRAKK